MISYFAGFLFLLCSILYPFVQHLIQVGGLFTETQNYQNQGCRLVQHPLLHGCESGQLIPGTDTVLMGKLINFLTRKACADPIERRKKWFPASLHWNSSVFVRGSLLLVNLRDASVTPLNLIGFEDRFFQTHGVGLVQDPKDPNKIIIAAVNHDLDGSKIEFFEHVRGTNEAHHYETFQDSNLLPAPNDVTPIDRNQFYATNDCANRKGLMLRVERYFAQPWSHVIYRDAQKKTRIAADNIIYANGITANAAGTLVYVVSTLGSFLHIFERKPSTGSLRLIEKVKLPMMGDNPAVDEATGAVYVTGHPNLLKWLKHKENTKLMTPSVIVKFSMQTVFANDGSLLSGGAVAVIDTNANASLAGGVYNSGLLVCDRAL